MYAILVGNNTQIADARSLAERLTAIAINAGFDKPCDSLLVRPDGPTEGWEVELLGPAGGNADFMLSVLAPKVPGTSPIYPFIKTVDGPLFAVTILPRAFGISRDDRRDFAEVPTSEEVCHQFTDFLATYIKTQRAK